MTYRSLEELANGDSADLTSIYVSDKGTFMAYNDGKVFFNSREGVKMELNGFGREGDQVIAARDVENYALGNSQGDILIFDSGKKAAEIKSDYTGGVSSLRYMSESKLAAAVGRNLRFYEKSGESYQQTQQIDLKGRIRSIYTVQENNNLFIVVDDERDTSSTGNRLVLVDSETNEMNSTQESLFGISRVLKINGKFVIGTANGELRVLNGEDLTPLKSSDEFKSGHKGRKFPTNFGISALSASDDMTIMASASLNGEIKVWNMDPSSRDFSKLEASARLGETPVTLINFQNSVYAIGRTGSVYKWAPAESGEDIVRIAEGTEGVVSVRKVDDKLHLIDTNGTSRTIQLG